MEKQCWVYVDSGECVDAVTVEEAIVLLQRYYRGCSLTPDNVVPERVAEEMIRAERAKLAESR
jgi:hypothetical protein